MADPIITPPIPTVKEGETPSATPPPSDQHIAQSIQSAFDRVLPPTKEEKQAAAKKTEAPATAKSSAAPEPTTGEPPSLEEIGERPPQPPQEEKIKLPSFIEKALHVEGGEPAPAPEPEEWPDELPAFKSKDEASNRYRKWRESYK